MVLNYNPPPPPGSWIGQLICPRENSNKVIRELGRRSYEKLPDNYIPLDLSPRSRHMGERKVRARRKH